MSLTNVLRTYWWLVHKDLLREIRAPKIWPVMLLLGTVIALMVSMPLELPQEHRGTLVGSLFWLAVFLSGVVALERSLGSEREDGCWQGLLRYPVAPGTIYLAKLTTNVLALCCLETLLVPAFALFMNVTLLAHPWQFLALLTVTNLGFAAIGTLLSALTNGIRQRGSLLSLLLLPLISPLMLGASQVTRALVVEQAEEAWRWGQLLVCFATVFVLLGTLVFEFVIED